MLTNYLTEYHEKIENNEILVSEKLKLQIEREKRFLKKYKFDNEKANKVIKFIETFCRHYKGDLAGVQVKLELWQKHMISSIFGFYKEDGTRLCRDATTIVARKNGKTFLGAGIGLYMFLADGEGSPEIYSLATKKEQANLLFKDVYKFVQYDSELSKAIIKRRVELECPINDGIVKALASDSNSLDGLNPSFWLKDEIHAWKNKELEEVMRSGAGARRQPLGLAITTAGTVRGMVYDNTYETLTSLLNGNIEDDSISAFIYELDHEEEVHDESNWIKANPNIDISVTKDFLKGEYKRVINDPIEKIGVWTKNFNIPMSGNEIFFTNEEIKPNEFDESLLEDTYGFMGLDMGYTTDITVLTYLTEIDSKKYTKQWYILPKNQVKNRLREDKVDYNYYKNRGEAVFFDGDTMNQVEVYNFMHEKMAELGIGVLKFGIDPYRADYILNELRNNYGEDSAKAVTNSYRKALTPTIYRFKKELKTRTLHSNSKLLELNLAGCVADINKEDEILLVKSKQRHRIDGVHSMIYAEKAYELYLLDMGINLNLNEEKEV